MRGGLLTEVRRIFGETGLLARRAGYEFRPQQLEMADAVASALTSQQHLIVEAPTGVGKTLAYLVPSLLYAIEEQRKAIISTHTKTLQEQLRSHDLPLARSLIGGDAKAVVLKGRRNYLCTTRLAYALASSARLFTSEQVTELDRINDWAGRTEDGDVENLGFTPHPATWDMVCSEKEVCNAARCGARCFFQRAKERARRAHLVVLNHALFFTLAALQEAGDRFIFENDFVVFDEAHTLESVAGAGLGRRVTRQEVLATLRKLYNPATKKGLIARASKSLKALCTEVEKTSGEFFDSLERVLVNTSTQRGDPSPRITRVRTPHVVTDTITGELEQLQLSITHAAADAATEAEQQELAATIRSLWEITLLTREFLLQSDERLTYWLEAIDTRGKNIALCASPSNIAETLGPELFRADTSVIMTSATLSVNGSLNYFMNRMGARDAQAMILGTPFDHERQMRILIAGDMPEPELPAYHAALPVWIVRSIMHSRGRALVLFTNSATMNAVASAVRERLEDEGILLLVQGGEHQRHALLQEFRHDVHSVLFGLESFWMGVDVPGEALEHVIITRLPFALPTHPLIEARMDAITQSGGNAFLDYILPEAILKLRQGVGRLIRTSTDHGTITILDSRILRRPYGRTFLSSLPRCPVEVVSAHGEAERYVLGEW